jgi:hypothetical protein
MMKRQADGTWRSTRQPIVVSEPVRRARWIEAEAIHLKRMGLSFDAIAQHITRVGRRETAAAVTVPEGITFGEHFTITKQACHKAFRKAIAREPGLEVHEFRKLDTDRCEEMYLSLQPAIRKDDARAIDSGVRVLNHKARLNGYAAPQQHELTGKDGKPLTLVQLLEAVGPIEEEEDGGRE